MFDKLIELGRAAFARTSGRSYADAVSVDHPEPDVALVALLRRRPGGASWAGLTEQMIDTGDPATVWAELTGPALLPDPDDDAALRAAAGDLRQWKQSELTFVSVLDPAYPAQLRDIHQAPPFLFAAGDMHPQDEAVSVVGSRNASVSGLAIAAEIAERLVDRAITVVSGLAAGIDTAAHRSVLDVGGRTVAVIGTGITRAYPAANRPLQDRIARDGLVLSQFWPDAPPTRRSFPIRNAVMSGYGFASVVVEAGENSDARIQARLAVEHGRPVVLLRAVVEATAWARRLMDQPGVYVAGDAGDALGIVDDLRRDPAEADRLLSTLAVGAS